MGTGDTGVEPVVLHNSMSPFCGKIAAYFREVKYGRREAVAPPDEQGKNPWERNLT